MTTPWHRNPWTWFGVSMGALVSCVVFATCKHAILAIVYWIIHVFAYVLAVSCASNREGS